MSEKDNVKNHLIEGETAVDAYMSKNWAWVLTDSRLLKYRKSDSGATQFYDISLSEISGIGLENTGMNEWWLFGGILLTILGIVAGSGFLGVGSPILLAVFWTGAAGCFIIWWQSDKIRFQFRGSGLIAEEPDRWKINASDVENWDEAREFVKSVRGQL